MANQNDSHSGVDRERVVMLVARFEGLRKEGAAAEERDRVLDELQDAVGLGGKMVMERDILRRAEGIVG